MIPRRVHAHGLPWLEWFADGHWVCRRCGESGRQPEFTDVASFARWLGRMKRAHAGCGTFDNIDPGEIGHPLNPDRAAPGRPEPGVIRRGSSGIPGCYEEFDHRPQ